MPRFFFANLASRRSEREDRPAFAARLRGPLSVRRMKFSLQSRAFVRSRGAGT
ncbi:hypothetical protein M885DRAFT_519440 [Pelagophyceae sp. CCMP2097]|nr:hypothetical protein M885DRAFT_519440 [Pelagophyceae sp. CCMP2097]